MKRLILPTFIILSLMFISLASANLILSPSPTQAIRFNETHTFILNVFDNSTGKSITSANCSLSLYNSSGSLLLTTNYIYSSPDYILTLNNNNFTKGDTLTQKIYCVNSGEGGFYSGTLDVNTNGQTKPSGVVIVAFSTVFLLLFIFGIVYFIRVIGLLSSLTVDLLDVGYMWGVFFGLLALLRLETIYLGNVEIYHWLSLFVSWAGIPFILIPMIAFFISLIANRRQQKKNRAKEGWAY